MADTVRESDVKRKDAPKPVCAASEEQLVTDVQIQALDTQDVPKIRLWRNDHRIWQWCRQNDFISDLEHEDWYRRQALDPKIKMYKIVALGKDKAAMVGVCGLTGIDMLNRRAEFSLYVFPGVQKKGFGRAGLSCLLTHGFSNLGLHVIWGESYEGNPGIRMFRALGFTKEGTRRDFYFRDGRFIDAHIYSMRANEWTKN